LYDAAAAAKAKPELLSLQLEFDESRSKTRLRSGILDVEAVYPILVSWLQKNKPSDQTFHGIGPQSRKII